MRTTSANSAFSGSLVNFPLANARLPVIEVERSWRSEVMKRLEELRKLEFGWDGYQAQPVALANIIFALNMLESTCRNEVPAPQIVPGVNGDLQIEWHTLNGDLELHVIAPNRVRGWHCIAGPAPSECEIELSFEFSAVAAWVKEITEQPRALNVAAA
jgi:hypothetical protein